MRFLLGVDLRGYLGVLDDVVSIHAVPAGSRLARVLGGSGGPKGLWPVELDTSPDLLDPGAMHSLHHLLLDFPGLLDCCHGGLLPLASFLLLVTDLLGRGLLPGLSAILGRCHHVSCRSESSNKSL